MQDLESEEESALRALRQGKVQCSVTAQIFCASYQDDENSTAIVYIALP
jgi:hypothetical protein